MARRLFLLGGAAALEAASREFVAAAGPDPEPALLLQGGPGWERYLPRYLEPWKRLGVRRYRVVAPDGDRLDVEAALEAVREATGIFIGGGNTSIYHRLYGVEPLRSAIAARYRAGVPLAGLSAGARLASRSCILDPTETGTNAIATVRGLGFVEDVVEAHFDTPRARSWLLAAMRATGSRRGWGMGDGACLVFEDGRFERVLGGPAYRVEMSDFASGAHVLHELT